MGLKTVYFDKILKRFINERIKTARLTDNIKHLQNENDTFKARFSSHVVAKIRNQPKSSQNTQKSRQTNQEPAKPPKRGRKQTVRRTFGFFSEKQGAGNQQEKGYSIVFIILLFSVIKPFHTMPV